MLNATVGINGLSFKSSFYQKTNCVSKILLSCRPSGRLFNGAQPSTPPSSPSVYYISVVFEGLRGAINNPSDAERWQLADEEIPARSSKLIEFVFRSRGLDNAGLESNNDQVCSCPRDWRLSTSGGLP